MSDDATTPQQDLLTQMLTMKPPESAEDMRTMLEGFAGLMNTDLPEVGAFHGAVPVAEGVSADVVVPQGAGPHPVLVYLHGGGWICGSPGTHRKLGYRFAEAGYLVFNVDYRLAPEHPFPTPFDDCVTAIRWAARQAAHYGGDATRLAIGGDSAGGNLAAAAAIALADDPAAPKAALLLYGVFDFAKLGETSDAAPEVPGPMAAIGKKLVDLMAGSYLGEDPGALIRDPRVSPIHAAHRLPPCHIMVGGMDPLVAQAESLAKALETAGTPFEHYVDEGMPHGYAQMEFFPAARPAIERMVEFLGKYL